MNTLILSTRGTNKSYKSRGIIGGIIMVIVGIFLLAVYGIFASQSSEPVLTIFLLLALLALADGIINIVKIIVFSKAYLDIFDNKVTGKGIQQLNVVDFSLIYSQIDNITITGQNININTAGNTYKVISDKETAKKIFDYYNQYMK